MILTIVIHEIIRCELDLFVFITYVPITDISLPLVSEVLHQIRLYYKVESRVCSILCFDSSKFKIYLILYSSYDGLVTDFLCTVWAILNSSVCTGQPICTYGFEILNIMCVNLTRVLTLPVH